MRTSILAFLAAVILAVGAASASAATAISSNWSGYAVTGTTFKTVSGTWVEPTASCTTASTTTASAFWVGLGGDSNTSNALEQTGTEADCLANGTVRYTAWYELVPKASVKVALKVSAGDKVTGSVSVSGTSVTLKLTNLTTHKSFTKTLAMSAPDVSSAEWIAEAPSTVTPGGTSVLPLTDFGTVKFSNATAVSTSGHTGTISDSAWTASGIELESRTGGGPGGNPFRPYAAYDGGTTAAIPTVLSSSGSAFSVRFRSGAAIGQV
jgi:hypothetical protein